MFLFDALGLGIGAYYSGREAVRMGGGGMEVVVPTLGAVTCGMLAIGLLLEDFGLVEAQIN